MKGPEFSPSNEELRDHERAARLFDISGEAGDMLGSFLVENPQLLKEYPQLAMIASEIAGMVFEKTCELLRISDELRSRVRNDDS
jgi:hypothetical protein